jgi:hypothetical protein
MFGNIQALASIRHHCNQNRPLPAELREWLADALDRYLEQDCETLNEAFGLIQARGGVPWWRERAIRGRDEALRALSREFFGHETPGRRARMIALLTRRYAAACWPRDRGHDEIPAHYRGTPNEYLWRAFRSRAKMPVSERHLRTLLGN